MNTALIKLQRKGQMVIPRSLREQVGVSEGTLMEVAVVEGGRLLLTPQLTVDRSILAGPKKSRKQLLQQLSAAVAGIRQDAQASALDKVSMKEINAEVAAHRLKRIGKSVKPPAK
jgi:AbrB family looped-hinge helix DNA binding protein